MPSTLQRVAAEFGGTAFLLAVIVGSGIMAQRLSGGNDGVALLANGIATGAGLYVLIETLAPVSAHFNPVVTALAGWRRQIGARLVLALVIAQFAGAFAGVLLAHAMFGEALLQSSAHGRGGWRMVLAEFVATSGLLTVVLLAPRRRMAGAVAAYITAAYWFTASTAFANPAVTLARAFTASFAGIAWVSVPGFLAAQSLTLAVVAVACRCARR